MSVRSIKAAILSVCLCILGFFSAGSATAEILTYDFNDGILGGLVVSQITPGFSATVSNGVLVTTKAPGTGKGYVYLAVPTVINGDFVARVTINRTSIGQADLGIRYNDIGDLFLWTASNINANYFTPYNTSVVKSNSATTVSLEIARVGDTVTTYFDTGSGLQFHSTRTESNYSDPATFTIFLQEESTSTAGVSGWFDNLTISYVPEPATLSLLAFAGIPLLRRRK